MSIRYQIIIRILLSSLCILVLGGAIAIWQARQAVDKEVDASISSALQFITLGGSENTPLRLDDLTRLRALRQTRHLTIELQKPNGDTRQLTEDQAAKGPETLPPAWFIRCVLDQYPEVRKQIVTSDGQAVTLVIKAQPLDEITEVWEESVAFFLSISLLTGLSFLTVNLVLNKSFQAIGLIVDALRMIETGQYRQQLPCFETTEFDIIAKAINRMTSELDKAQAQNRALTQHSLVIQEDERQRLSQELHDEFGQSLTAIKVMAVAATHEKADPGKISVSITDICDHLMGVVRSMMQQLHPLILTELGLKATLEDMVNHWSERNPELSLSLQCCDEVDYLEKHATIQIFRVIQECLTNVVRHAQASHVTIALEVTDDAETYLQCRIQDDGRGCDLSNTARGFGLLGMKERIQSLAGKLTLQSQPNQGMTITASIPLS